jgi:cytochrome oxidase Cu insertion factor (SCO1/SenC/PrrC family)
MPNSDTPVADLWPGLSSALLRSFGWMLLAAVVIGLATYAAWPWRPELLDRIRLRLSGPGGEREPLARRFLRISFGLLWIADGLLLAQPKMPGAFAQLYLGGNVGPTWFTTAQLTVGRAWLRHPIAADVAAVWVQLGLGLLFLLGGRGLLNRLACVAAIAWSLVVWFFGEAMGGLVAAGSGWLTGAPGAALLYAIAAVALLPSTAFWTTGRAQQTLRWAAASWLALAAALQALPGEQFWTSAGLAAPFQDGSATNPSAALRAPITALAHRALDEPAVVNGLVIGGCAVLALALWRSGRTMVLGAGVAWCLATWWLAQDFGVLGGTRTDPNAALPLALLLAAALPVWQDSPVPAAAAGEVQPAPSAPTAAPRAPLGWRLGGGAAAATLAIALLVVTPAVFAAGVGAPADATAVAANSNGGLITIPRRPLPAFTLQDQAGRTVSPGSLRGSVVVLTFLDPVCTSDCPVIANQLALADRQLGPLAQRVQFVALDSNPVFHNRADVRAFTDSHGLGSMTNWHFLWGRAATLQNLLVRFGITVDVPVVGMIEHSEAVYFVGPDGLTDGYLDDGAADELTSAYAAQVRAEVKDLLW